MSYAITPSTRGVKIRPTVLGKLVWGSHRQSVVKKKKNPPANAGDARDLGSIPGGGNGNPLQYSFLEKPMDRGA